jgi:hypothetical protein
MEAVREVEGWRNAKPKIGTAKAIGGTGDGCEHATPAAE